MGEESDLNKIYKVLDILCVSSIWGEGFPNVIGEAMSNGVLCISTDVGDAKRIIGENGVIVDANNHKELAKGCLSLIRMNKDETRILKKKAFNEVKSKYSIKLVRKVYREVAVEILNSH